ncbi:MAG TPA: SDR family oxidoreductase [Chthonomonadaceae bacterium]|nr:SDR family oxidoreductase [Chthonomonadaceae bacterium]
MEGLQERTALVTGASGGIGSAIARAYARQGMRVAVHFNTSEDAARRTLAELEGDGHLLVQADVAEPESIRRMIAETVAAFGRLDVLVNNAGIYELGPFDMADYAAWQTHWQHTLDINLMSAANATYCALPVMKAQGGGKVINVASRAAFRGETEAPAYAVSKAGMISLTRCLARAEAKNGILSYGIAPGWVETAMAREGMETMAEEILAQIPLGRIATVEDVAGVALFLASDAANYLTGITILVAGGSWWTT